MNKFNFLPKLAIASLAGSITTISIATVPAQALTGKGSIDWEGVTGDFIGDVNPNPGFTDTLTIDFNIFPPPAGTDDTTVTQTTDDFATWLGAIPPIMSFDMPEEQMQLEQFDPTTDPRIPPTIAAYRTTNETIFDFTDKLLPDAPGFNNIEGLRWVVPQGTNFLVSTLTANVTTLTLCGETCEGRPFWEKDVDGDGIFEERWEAINIMSLSDLAAAPNGEYVVLSVKRSVPEPGTIIGLIAISGLGLGLKRKKQS